MPDANGGRRQPIRQSPMIDFVRCLGYIVERRGIMTESILTNFRIRKPDKLENFFYWFTGAVTLRIGRLRLSLISS